MANSFYATGRDAFLNGQIDYLNDTIKMVLVNDGYQLSITTDQYLSELLPFISALPQTLTSKTLSNGIAGCDDVLFPAVAAGQTVAYVIVYKDTGSVYSSQLILCLDTDSANFLPADTNNEDWNVYINLSNNVNKLFLFSQ
jgi:hypothetical protein